MSEQTTLADLGAAMGMAAAANPAAPVAPAKPKIDAKGRAYATGRRKTPLPASGSSAAAARLR